MRRDPREPTSVAVVGGGLAGIAAAVALADAGRRVYLLEARPRFGGATASFHRHGLAVDTGQHVLVRSYTRHQALLERLGVAHRVAWQSRLDVPVLLGPGSRTRPPPAQRQRARLRRSRLLPAPAHLGPAVLGYRGLTGGDRVRAGRAALALRRLDPDDSALDQASFGAWLGQHGQSAVAVRRLWGLFSTAALNLSCDEASLALAVRVFRTGLLDHRCAGDLGLPVVPLEELHGRPAAALLDRLGATVAPRRRVLAVTVGDAGGFVVRTAGADLEVDQVVLAVPHPQAAAMLPDTAAPGAPDWAGLGSSAILNVHVVVDRPVLDVPFAAAPDSAVQWIFDKTGAAGLERGQYLVTSVSAADPLLPTRAVDLIDSHLAALRGLLPTMERAEVLDAFVTREPRATFAARPGTAALRPPTLTAHPGLVLAGAWTATGWPDTTEGAVRSGEAAADALLRAATVRPGSTSYPTRTASLEVVW